MKFYIILFTAFFLTSCEKTDPPSAFGTLERDRITLTATANEILLLRHVPEGAQVKQGDLLLSFDNQLETQRVAQMQADVDRLQASLNFYQNGTRQEQIASAKARMQQAQVRRNNAQHELERRESLRNQSMISASDLDQAKLQRDIAQAQWEDSNQQLHELQNGSREEVIAQALASLKNAQALLAQETKKLNDLQIVATRDGTIEDFPFEVGERVPMGAVVVIIASNASPYARLSLPETSLAHYKVNDPVNIIIDGTGTPVNGKIRFISPRPFFTPYFALHQSERSRLMFKVEVDLQNANNLPTGVPLHMELK